MSVDQKILSRLDELIEMGGRVIATKRSPGQYIIGDDRVDGQLAMQWIASCLNIFLRVFGDKSAHYNMFSKLTESQVTYSPAYRAFGVLKAAKEDYENGYLFGLRQLIEAELFDDFLEQAEELLGCSYFQAAAVLAGAVLEDSLRKLCILNEISITGKPKLDQMNSDLAKIGVYSKLVQKKVRYLRQSRRLEFVNRSKRLPCLNV